MISALLVSAALLFVVPRSAHADTCIEQVTVYGYQEWPTLIIVPWADLSPLTPVSGTGPAGAYSANPTTHTKCTTSVLATAQESQSSSPASQPTNTSLAIPLRYANPIDIANGSSVGAAYGGTNGSAGFMVFPNYAAGANAAMKSLANYAAAGYSIYSLINTWAPSSVNPNAMTNTLTDLGITSALASSTLLSSLTSNQQMEIIAAFAWQEGFKPSGC
ncbi:MAG: hypothetical protein QM718_12795 [Steroidobacteraceae bacterium]